MAQLRGKQIRQNSISLDRLDLNTYSVGDTINGIDPGKVLVNKEYTDIVSQGWDPKDSCRYASVSNITSILTANEATVISSLDDIESPGIVELYVADRILIKDQTDPIENGIYIWNGTNLERALDFDGTPDAEVSQGAYTFVSEGINVGGYTYMVISRGSISDETIDVGIDPIVWTEVSKAPIYLGDNGITVDGNTIKLGGDIIENTVITGNNTTFNLGGTNPSTYFTTLTLAGDTTRINTDSFLVYDPDLTNPLINLTSTSLTSYANSFVLNQQSGSPVLNVAPGSFTASQGSGAPAFQYNPAGLYLYDTTPVVYAQISPNNFNIKTGGGTNTTVMSINSSSWFINSNAVTFNGKSTGWYGDGTGNYQLAGFNQIQLATGNAQLLFSDTSYQLNNNNFSLSVNSTNIVVSSVNANHQGIIYGADYSADFVDLSLVNKKWVVDQISAIPTEVANTRRIKFIATFADVTPSIVEQEEFYNITTTTGTIADWSKLSSEVISIKVNGLEVAIDGSTDDPFWFSDSVSGTKSYYPTVTLNKLYVDTSLLGYNLDDGLSGDEISVTFDIYESPDLPNS